MQSSLSVVRLDIYSIQQYLGIKQIGLYAGIGIIFAFIFGSFTFSIGILMVYALFYSSYPFIMAEKNQLDLLYATLPLRKSTLVAGRYLFALTMNLYGAVFAIVLGAVYSMIKKEPFFLPEQLLTLLLIFVMFTFVTCLQFPFYFKLGYTKAKIVAMMPLMFIPVVVIGIEKLMPNGFETLVELIQRNPAAVVIGVAVVWILTAVGSIALSQRLYAKREF